MPELPDVEGFRRLAERLGLHHGITRTGVPDPASLKGLTPAALQARLHGRTLHACRRHGKFLFLDCGPGVTLAMHFGTNGALRYTAHGQPEPQYVRLWLAFAGDGRLDYVNSRRIGHVQAVADSATFVGEQGLGPDVLDPGFTATDFAAALTGSRQTVKALLMDQTRLAGIGNIYSDEILFQARLHPATIGGSLDMSAARHLYDTMQSVLQTAVACGAGAENFTDRLPKDFLLPKRRSGGRCPRCGAEIRSLKSGGRTAYYCPGCQPTP